MPPLGEVVHRLYGSIGHPEAWKATELWLRNAGHVFVSSAESEVNRLVDSAEVATHLKRAADLHDRVVSTLAACHMFQGALDWLAIAVMAVTPSARVVLKNDAATRVLEARDPLRESAEGLVACTAADTRQLRETVAARCPAPRAVVLSRTDGRRASAVIAGVASGHAVLFLRDLDDPVQMPPALLSKIYGLTRAEEQFALALARGQSVEEAAKLLGIAPSTARTHLKRIFLKTDTNRQGQLVSLLLSNPASQTRSPFSGLRSSSNRPA